MMTMRRDISRFFSIAAGRFVTAKRTSHTGRLEMAHDCYASFLHDVIVVLRAKRLLKRKVHKKMNPYVGLQSAFGWVLAYKLGLSRLRFAFSQLFVGYNSTQAIRFWLLSWV